MMSGSHNLSLTALSRPVRVYLTGGEGIGWALDESLALTRRTLAPLGDLVAAAPLASADVVYSEDPQILAAYHDDQLAGKRIVCQADNDVYRLMGRPDFARPRQIVGLWAAQNRTDERRLMMSGLRAVLIPLPVDTSIFRPDAATPGSIASFKKKWGIPEDRFLVGNFMRDSLGDDLSEPKPQKHPELFLEIVRALHVRGVPVHAVLAGPRRHWLRSQLAANGLPYSFIGDPVPGDDLKSNILDKTSLSVLYQAIDLYLLTSRWESGSRVVLEAAASRCPVLSTYVGLSPDVLEPASLYRTPDEAVAAIVAQNERRTLDVTLDKQFARVMANHTPDANAARYRSMYESMADITPYWPPLRAGRTAQARRRGAASMFVGRVQRSLSSRLGLGRARATAPLHMSLWHEFHKPPYGGGNQFMLALRGALERMGVEVSINRSGPAIDVHLCNSLWFDVDALISENRRRPVRMLHRIDGPVSLYRGVDRAEDDRIFEANARFASATILQSDWCYERLVEMGYRPVNPFIIRNAVDGAVFHSRGRAPFDRRRKTRLIASSWSDNVRKGGSMYRRLDESLDWERYEFTFVGRTQETFSHIKHVPAVGSEELAALHRAHDVYVTCSQNDPCSNALIEALSSGLPAVYLAQGGHPELVAEAGLGFSTIEEAPGLLDRVVTDYELFQRMITADDIDSVARKYVAIARHVIESS
jgi:glycosyltransferase involved in cell wall biosynthesis